MFGTFQYILCYGSTLCYYYLGGDFLAFQYILCYGSTVKPIVYMFVGSDFNTSYVTVQPLLNKRKHFLT